MTFRDLATSSEGRVKDSKQKKGAATNELSAAKNKATNIQKRDSNARDEK